MSWQTIATTLTALPYWLARPGTELDKLRRAAVRFWQRVEDAMNWPALQLDPLTADLELVHLLAWERDIAAIPGESEQLYRTRVKYALPFAKGAGSKQGWLSMFAKLGMEHITLDERVSPTDWDVVSLQMLDQDVGPNQPIIGALCRQYGRTTRRYEFSTIATMPLMAPPNAFDAAGELAMARLSDNAQPAFGLAVMDFDTQLAIARTKQ